MRNLLINLTLILALISFSFTNVSAQEWGSGQVVQQSISITIQNGTNTTTHRGGIVVPIIPLTGEVRAPHPTIKVRVDAEGEGFQTYTFTASYEAGWKLVIPNSVVSNWEVGNYILTAKIGAQTVINETIVKE